MKNYKETRFFSIFEYDKEEDYLMSQHRKGWIFEKLDFLTYKFVKGQPADMIYQLEYTGTIEDKDTYLQMMADYGWEYLGEYYNFSYFRKLRDESHDSPQLFTDSESKLSHLNKILIRRFFLALGLLILIIAISFEHTVGDYVLIVLVVVFLTKLIKDYLRIRRKIEQEE